MNDDVHKLVALKGCVARLACAVSILDDISYYPLTEDECVSLADARRSLVRLLEDTRHRGLELGRALNMKINGTEAEE